jgi:sugar phosphate permease
VRGRRDVESSKANGMCCNTVHIITSQARRGELFTLWKFSSAIGSPGQPCLTDLTLFCL